MKRETVVISLGGSIIAPNDVDVKFLKKFSVFVKRTTRTHRLAIITGGGATARRYAQAAAHTGQRSTRSLHEVGIKACQLNAELLRAALDVPDEVALDSSKLSTMKQNPLLVAPSTPGYTSDYGSILIAKAVGAKRVINVTNVKGVYTADPRKVRTATLLKKLSWKQFVSMFGSSVRPGMHVPFDPLASRLAQRSGISVVVTGADLKNLSKVVAGRSYSGTALSA